MYKSHILNAWNEGQEAKTYVITSSLKREAEMVNEGEKSKIFIKE